MASWYSKDKSTSSDITKFSDDKNTPVKSRISEMRRKLGILAGFSFDRATDREIARVAGELVVNQLNGEKDVIIDKIRNNVALGKRENLKEYLEQVAKTDAELLRIGEETKKQLSYNMQEHITQIVKDKKKWKNQTELLFTNGEIEQQDRDNMVEMHELEALELIQGAREDKNTVRDTYRKRLEHALAEYIERNPNY